MYRSLDDQYFREVLVMGGCECQCTVILKGNSYFSLFAPFRRSFRPSASFFSLLRACGPGSAPSGVWGVCFLIRATLGFYHDLVTARLVRVTWQRPMWLKPLSWQQHSLLREKGFAIYCR